MIYEYGCYGWGIGRTFGGRLVHKVKIHVPDGVVSMFSCHDLDVILSEVALDSGIIMLGQSQINTVVPLKGKDRKLKPAPPLYDDRDKKPCCPFPENTKERVAWLAKVEGKKTWKTSVVKKAAHLGIYVL